MKATIFVRLKEDVLDVAGRTTAEQLRKLGFTDVKDTRIGKLIEIELEGSDTASLEQHVERMCTKLLANSNTEEFEVRFFEDE